MLPARFTLLAALCAALCACGNSQPAAKSAVRAAAHQPALNWAYVHYRDLDDLNRLAARYDAAEQVDRKAGTVTLLLGDAELAELRLAGYIVDVDAARSATLNQPPAPAPNQTVGIPGFPCYRTVNETEAALAALAQAHPQLVELRTIGSSWIRANTAAPAGDDLTVARLTNRAIAGDKPVFFLYAAIHARETTTAETATRFAEYLVNGYGTDADATWLLDHNEIHVLPLANPDGRRLAEEHLYWRKNANPEHCPAGADPAIGVWSAHGVDLNRNASFKWGELNNGGSSGFECDQTYRGPAAASEPETQALQDYARRIFPDQRNPGLSDAAPDDTQGVFITLHNFARLVLFPWGWTDAFPAPNDRQLERLGLKFGFFNHYQVCSDCLYLANGTSDDFTYGELGVASYTFEMGHEDFFESCSTFESETYPDNLPALIYAAKAARRPYQLPFGPDSLELHVSAAAKVPAGVPVLLSATADGKRYENNGDSGTTPVTVAGARYSIDVPSWKGGATSALRAVDGAFDSTHEVMQTTIATSGLHAGRHLLFVESLGANGQWGAASAVFLDIQ